MAGSELVLQSALARILTDAVVREQVFRSDTEAMQRLGLTAEQGRQMREIDHQRVELFAELLVINRLSKAMEGLPMTTQLLGADIWNVARAFNQACPPTEAKKYVEALAFGQFLQDKWCREPSSVPYAADVLCYEMSFLEVRFGRPEPAIADLTLLPALPGDGVMDVVPLVVTPCRVVAMNYDVDALRSAIQDGRTPSREAERPTILVIAQGPRGEAVEHEISMGTLLFLQACDGVAALGDVIEQLANAAVERSRDALASDCVALCEDLIASGLMLVGRRCLGVERSR